jgi:hypothetical protein
MHDQDARLLNVLVKTCDNVGDAGVDLKAPRERYQKLGTSYNFDVFPPVGIGAVALAGGASWR